MSDGFAIFKHRGRKPISLPCPPLPVSPVAFDETGDYLALKWNNIKVCLLEGVQIAASHPELLDLDGLHRLLPPQSLIERIHTIHQRESLAGRKMTQQLAQSIVDDAIYKFLGTFSKNALFAQGSTLEVLAALYDERTLSDIEDAFSASSSSDTHEEMRVVATPPALMMLGLMVQRWHSQKSLSGKALASIARADQEYFLALPFEEQVRFYHRHKAVTQARVQSARTTRRYRRR
jgi:hypothetical protein